MTSQATAMPESFPAGTTVAYVKVFPDYPAPTWVLTLNLAGPSVYEVDADELTGGGFEVIIPAVDSAALLPGVYQWSERVSLAGEVYEVGRGTVVITADLAGATAGSLQDWAEKTLPIVEAAIAGRLPSGLESYQIAGRAISKIPLDELFKIRARLQAELQQVRNPDGFSRTHFVKFTKPGA